MDTIQQSKPEETMVVTRGLRLMASNAVGFLALFVALGGVGYAAVGGFASGGKLQACVNRNGSLILLKTGKKCGRGQTAISWSQTGPAGRAGLNGAAGATGATGAAGAKGSTGLEGPKGQEGAPGTALAFASYEGSFQSFVPGTSAKNLTEANFDRRETGVYCLKNLAFVPQTAIVSANNAFAENDTVASVLVVKPGETLSPCAEGEFIRVRTVKSTTGALKEGTFTIWLN
jgi:hypothetical protein